MDNISIETIFSNKDIREGLEVEIFLERYNEKCNTNYIIFQKRDKPDYFIKNSCENIKGIELSSVYRDDRVVGHDHKLSDKIVIPYDPKTHQDVRDCYFERIFKKIDDKRMKIKSGIYDTTHSIILSLYLNDYYIHHISNHEWKLWININKSYFSQIKEFNEILLLIGDTRFALVPCGN